MTSHFEAYHPRCGHCGAWGVRQGDKIRCNNPRCARTSTYVAPPDALIPITGYRLPRPRRKASKPDTAPAAQPQFDFEQEDENEPDQHTNL